MSHHRALALTLTIVATATLIWLTRSSASSDDMAAARSPHDHPGTSRALPGLVRGEFRPSKSWMPAEIALRRVREGLSRWFETNAGDMETQETITRGLLGLLDDENTAETVRSLTSREFDTPFGIRALERWLAIDPLSAARWIGRRADARDEHALIVAKALLHAPEDLYSYCDTLPEAEWKWEILEAASLEAIPQNRSVALALAGRLTEEKALTNVHETIAYEWFGADPSGALRWARNIADPMLRERLLAMGAKAIATSDPDLAARWLEEGVKNETLLAETTLNIVESWAVHQPQKAAKWVVQLPHADSRKSATDLLLTHWMKSDAASAQAWIQTLPESESISAAQGIARGN